MYDTKNSKESSVSLVKGGKGSTTSMISINKLDLAQINKKSSKVVAVEKEKASPSRKDVTMNTLASISSHRETPSDRDHYSGKQHTSQKKQEEE